MAYMHFLIYSDRRLMKNKLFISLFVLSCLNLIIIDIHKVYILYHLSILILKRMHETLD